MHRLDSGDSWTRSALCTQKTSQGVQGKKEAIHLPGSFPSRPFSPQRTCVQKGILIQIDAAPGAPGAKLRRWQHETNKRVRGDILAGNPPGGSLIARLSAENICRQERNFVPLGPQGTGQGRTEPHVASDGSPASHEAQEAARASMEPQARRTAARASMEPQARRTAARTCGPRRRHGRAQGRTPASPRHPPPPAASRPGAAGAGPHSGRGCRRGPAASGGRCGRSRRGRRRDPRRRVRP